MVHKLARWGDETTSLASITEERSTQSSSNSERYRSSIGLEPVGELALNRRRRIEEDREDLQSIVASEDNDRYKWLPQSKVLISLLLTFFMAVSTVRVRSESRMASIPSSTTVKQVLMHSQNMLSSKATGGFATMSQQEQQSLDTAGISKSLQYMSDITDKPFNATKDVPFFFHVPRSSGSSVKDVLGGCYGMVAAATDARKQKRTNHLRDSSLKIVHAEDDTAFVNVDTTTVEGIDRAKQLGLVESRLADVIISQHLHPAATLFNEEQNGQCFTMIRHPIDRAVSLFHYLAVANWEPTYDPSLAYVTIEMYARSKRAEHNWMTRLLSNELERDLTEYHVAIAKKVLRKKCLVGLLQRKEESFQRFEQYFGWHARGEYQAQCRERVLHWGWGNKHSHPLVEEGTVVWDLLLRKNNYDMELYEYAKELFSQQAVLFKDNVVSPPANNAVDQQPH